MKKAHKAQAGSLCHQGFRTFERSLLLKIPKKIHTPIKGIMMTDDLDNPNNFGGTGFQPVQSFQNYQGKRTGLDMSLI